MQVTRFSLFPLSLKIRHEMSQAAFIALDTEFSGLGGPSTRSANLKDRYAALRATATSSALLSLGVVVGKSGNSDDVVQPNTPTTFTSRAFDFLLSPKNPFEISPSSAAFLVDHAFDFNKMFREGINPDQLRDLFAYILQLNVPIVIHNGLLDLMFIYHTLYAELPADLDTFVADLNDMFPAGIIDTKYVADYVTHEKASYLAYLYRKYERNILKSESLSISLLPPIDLASSIVIPASALLPNGQISATLSLKGASTATTDTIIKKKRSKQQEKDDRKLYCVQYASHGYCSNGPACSKSHDLDLILDSEERESLQAAGRKRAKGDTSTVATATGSSTHDTMITNNSKPQPKPIPTPLPLSLTTETLIPTPTITPTLLQTYHSASFDAYMTGYVFCVQFQQLHPPKNAAPSTPKERLAEFVKAYGNKLYLIGKDIPLSIVKSSFAKTSVGHVRQKMVWKK
ncbi:UNVERIFIED_CONTAM: Target of EGR1, member 1 (Nuclear) [Siphonaria sp. JEL0065]|nr:Target of EGR1, member 1 (Nuclear) [Siphonaria sp. JEL0065]